MWKLLWLALLALPVLEVGAHVAARAAVPALSDWRAAAEFVRGELAARDLITSAPSWTDPQLRSVLGDRIDLPMAGRSDTAAYERLWSLSIRGARPAEALNKTPELERRFGEVTVQRFRLAPSSVVLDLTERFARDLESVVVSNGARECTFQKLGLSRGGGLGYGVLPPAQRTQCGPSRNSPWVAPVVMEDLSLAARRCIFHPPGVGTPIRVLLRDVELSDQLVFYGGVYYEHERMRKGAPIAAVLYANDREIGRLTHRDGDGWKKLVLSTARGRTNLAIDVSSTGRKQRSFCWAASTRLTGTRATGTAGATP